MYNLLTNAGFSGLPSEAVWTNCSLKAPESTKKSVTDEIYKLLQKHNAQGFQANNNTKSLINTLPQSWRFSKLCGLRFLDWMMGLPKAKRDQAVKEIYLYASSQSDKSSVYYKLS